MKHLLLAITLLACTRKPPDLAPESFATRPTLVSLPLEAPQKANVQGKNVICEPDKHKNVPYVAPDCCRWQQFSFDVGYWYLLCQPYNKDGSRCLTCFPKNEDRCTLRGLCENHK